MKKLKRKRKSSTSRSQSEITAVRHPFSGVDPDVLREAFGRKALHSAEEFPKLLAAIDDRLGQWYPPFLIAIIAGYGLQVGVGSEGVPAQSFARTIQQHHVEMLQALMLRRPMESWGTEPPPPQAVQEVIDDLIRLADAFHSRRLVAVAEERDEQGRIVLALQERLRSHTQIVRNWGYFSAVVRISAELYKPLDDAFRQSFGFAATDLIDVAGALVSTLEQRASDRMQNLRKVLRAPTIKAAVKAFYANFPQFKGTPEHFIASIPRGTKTQSVKYRLLAMSDMELVDHAIANIQELATKSGRAPEVVRSVLAKLSRHPDALRDGNLEHYFLANPVWTAPGMEIGEEFFSPTPQAVFSHIHSIMSSLAEESGNKKRLEGRRAEFLEQAIKRVVEEVFGDAAKISPGAKWKSGGVQYETDLICRVDRTVMIIEAKSAALSPQGLRGAPDRVKRHVQDLVTDPAAQSQRLQQIIRDAKEGSADAAAICATLQIAAEEVDTVVRVSVTLDDFSMISSAERDLKAAGWVPAELRLAPTMNLADFEVIGNVLSEPAFFLHYLAERERIQKTIETIGDELDYLGLYLETGFNFASLEKGDTGLVITGMSAKIDKYFSSLDAGVVLQKPMPKVSDELAEIVAAVKHRCAKGWTTISLDILRVGNLKEQHQLFRSLESLRKSVADNFRDPRHLCSLVVNPPGHHEACVILYVYPQALRDTRDDVVSELAGNALAEQGRMRCTIVGKSLEAWERPYDFVALAFAPKPDKADS